MPPKHILLTLLSLTGVLANPKLRSLDQISAPICCDNVGSDFECSQAMCTKRDVSISVRVEGVDKCPQCPVGFCCISVNGHQVCHDECTTDAAIAVAKRKHKPEWTDSSFCDCKSFDDCCYDFAGMYVCGGQCNKDDAIEKAKRIFNAPAPQPVVSERFIDSIADLSSSDTQNKVCCLKMKHGHKCWHCTKPWPTQSKRADVASPTQSELCCFIDGVNFCGKVCTTQFDQHLHGIDRRNSSFPPECCDWGGVEWVCGPVCMSKDKANADAFTLSDDAYDDLHNSRGSCADHGNLTICDLSALPTDVAARGYSLL